MSPSTENAEARPDYSLQNFDFDVDPKDFYEFYTTMAGHSIKAIHLCCLEERVDTDVPTNPWELCLEISDTACVMFEMMASNEDYGRQLCNRCGCECCGYPGGKRGKVMSYLTDDHFTHETIHAVTYRPRRTVFIDEFVRLICKNGRDAYSFSPEREGGRFWMMVVMRDLEDAGWVETGSADQAKEALKMYWSKADESVPRVMREGTFREY